ncbi:MAG: alanine and proline-rich secreted protein Apa, partial [Myxococcales bacterium]|nr:alanine and proline-rich secreted protein Apa [Myxococcales bacterium]
DAEPPPSQDPGDAEPPPSQDPGDAEPPPSQDPGDAEPPPSQDPGDAEPPPSQDPNVPEVLPQEGEACASALLTCDVGLTCLKLRTTAQSLNPDTPEGICLLRCETADDCRASSLSPTATLCSPNQVCVHDLAPEGGFADFSSIPIVDCPTGTKLMSDHSSTLEPGTFSCVRPCTTDNECLGDTHRYCNVNNGAIRGPQALPGHCAEQAPLPAGSKCSTQNATQTCSLDRANHGHLLCLDLFDQTHAQAPDAGICTQLCGDLDNNPTTPNVDCQPQAPDQPAPACDFELLPMENLGVCSEQCSSFPNDCTAPQACVPFIDICMDMEAIRDDVLPIYNASRITAQPQIPPSAEENCAGRENQCPQDAFCAIFGSTNGVPSIGGCVYGCNPRLPPARQGCSNKTIDDTSNLICVAINPAIDPTVGFCQAR